MGGDYDPAAALTARGHFIQGPMNSVHILQRAAGVAGEMDRPSGAAMRRLARVPCQHVELQLALCRGLRPRSEPSQDGPRGMGSLMGLVRVASTPPNKPLHLTAAGFSQVAVLSPSRVVVICSRGRK